MIDPPSPGIVALILAAAARMTWRSLTTDPQGRALGALYDASGTAQAFTATASTAPSSAAWALLASLPAGCAGYLLPADAANALQHGDANTDGSITLDGRVYRIVATWNGAQHVAECRGA